MATYQTVKKQGPPQCRVMDLLVDEASKQLAIASQGTAYGKSFCPPKNCSFGMILQFASPGTINVKVELESGIAEPSTEGSADSLWAVGDTVIAAVASSASQAVTAAPVVAPFCRLKLTGLSGNDAGTYLSRCYFTFEKNL